ncbi:cell division suppressor protein YneA [Bacillus sp. 2205SS5-2]|uniref:cell division suppressor protein YneA n=1 Tax=Bacillus sp. 2205SS5-2 TaxID=3109031 RepID=UPI003006930C
MITFLKNNNFVVLLMILTFISGLVMLNQLEETDTSSYLHITVEKGDSLWTIADQYQKLHGMNKSDFIRWVSDQNEMKNYDLIAGESIYIPVKFEEIKQMDLNTPQYALKGE